MLAVCGATHKCTIPAETTVLSDVSRVVSVALVSTSSRLVRAQRIPKVFNDHLYMPRRATRIVTSVIHKVTPWRATSRAEPLQHEEHHHGASIAGRNDAERPRLGEHSQLDGSDGAAVGPRVFPTPV